MPRFDEFNPELQSPIRVGLKNSSSISLFCCVKILKHCFLIKVVPMHWFLFAHKAKKITFYLALLQWKSLNDEIELYYRVQRGTFCQFLFWWIYICHRSKSTGKETFKTHLCGVGYIGDCTYFSGNSISGECVCSFHVTAVKKYFDDHLLTLPHMGCEVKASRVLYRITLTVIYKFFLFTSGWINLQILRRNLTKSVRGRDFTVCRLHHTHVPREQTAGTTWHQNLVTLNLRSKKEKKGNFSHFLLPQE